MKILGTALVVTLLAALGAGSASGAGSAGISSVAVATATAIQSAAVTARLDSPSVPSGLSLTAELSTLTLTHNENDNDADDENDNDDAKDAAKDKTSKHHGALDKLRGVLDLLVKAGTITAAQETAILDAAKDAFKKKSHAKPEQSRAGEFHFTGAIFKVVREFLDVTQKDITENAKAGKSLAELAVAKGKTRDGLILAIVATIDKPTAATSAAVAALVDHKGRPNAGRNGENEKRKHEKSKHGQNEKVQNEKGQTNGGRTR